MLDVFAWIVLIVLLASTVAVVTFLAMLPGMIAAKRQHPMGASGDGRGMGHAIPRLRAVAG